MALYWVGGTATYDGTTNRFATTSGGVASVALPTSSDDVFFDTLSNATAYTCTISATLNCRDLNIANPLSGALTLAGASAINVYGNFTISSTITRTWSGGLSFSSTATGKTITFNSISMGGAIAFNGQGGGWTLQDALNNSTLITHTAGTLDTNGKAVTCTAFSSTGALTRTLTLGASTLTLSGASAWTISGSNYTFNCNTSTITMSGSATFAGAGATYYIVAFTGATATITGANSYTTFSYTGTAVKTCTLSVGADQTVSGTFTVAGNSVTNRILVFSDVPGTARTISSGTVTTSNSDWQDITGTGAGSWNLSAITGLSGDCGGNSGLTLTTPATQTATGTVSFTWSTHGWTSRVPLPQDDVVINNAFGVSQSVTADMARLGKSINFTGATYTTSLGFANSVSCVMYGSLTLITGMTVSGGGGALTFAGRSTYTLTNAGCTWNKPLVLSAPSGTLTLQDALTTGLTRTVTITAGTFNANGYNVSTGLFDASGTITRTVTMGSGAWTLTGTGTIWNFNVGTNLTFNRDTATITANNNTASARSVIGNTNARTGNFFVTAGTGTFTPGAFYVTDLDFTGFAGTLGVGVIDLAGNLTLASGMTVTDGANVVTFSATSGTKTITSNGVAFSRPVTFDGVGGTWALQDAFVGGAGRRVVVTNGTLNLNNKNTTIGLITVDITGTLTMGSGTLELTGTGSTTTNINASATINGGTSTIKVTDSSASAITLALGGKTYNNLWFARGASTASNTISGNNTFAEIKDTGTVAHSMLFTNSSNTSFSTWSISGTAGNVITINSSGTAIHTLTNVGGGVVSADYLNIQHSVATPSPFYAGVNSVNNQAVATAGSGWVFTAPVLNNSNFLSFF